MADLKQCTKCGEWKPLDQFGKEKRVKSGLTARCKKCMHAYHAAWCKTERGRELTRATAKRRYHTTGREYQREYSKSDQFKDNQKRYKQSERGKAAQRRYIERNQDRCKARHAVGAEVERGRMQHISTCTCARCDSGADHYHHHNGYALQHRLDVTSLCHQCHVGAHR